MFSRSYKYSHKDDNNIPIYKNDPKHENDPSWDNYRLSWTRMNSIREDSNPKWRLTCNFDTDGPVYTDYLRANHKDLPILPDSSSKYHVTCKTVEFINIRGTRCNNCEVLIAHDEHNPLHIDSHYSDRCSNNFPGSEKGHGPGEDNFGLYYCRNKQHRCSSTEESTTQLWFGGE